MYSFTSNKWVSVGDKHQYSEVSKDFDDLNGMIDKETAKSSSKEVTKQEKVTQMKDTLKKTVKFSKYNSSTVSVQMFAATPIKDSENLLRRKRMIPETVFLDERITDQIDNNLKKPKLKGHKMVLIESGLLVFGGKTSNGSFSNTLWHYNLSSRIWSKKAEDSIVKPSPVWLHCMLLMDNGDHLYTFGGSTEGGKFLSEMFRIRVQELDTWERVEMAAGNEMEMRLTGHSCVQYEDSILVFGGLTTDMARFSKLSKRLLTFSTRSRIWSEIKYSGAGAPPEMAFHSAVRVGHYMLLFGGYVHMHGKYEKCYENSLFFYNLLCHSWQTIESEHDPLDHDYPRLQGMFGHAAIVRRGTQMVVTGGYHGSVTGDMIGYTVPGTLTTQPTPCHLYGKRDACIGSATLQSNITQM